MSWVDTGIEYDIAIVEGQIVARNAKGKELAKVPAKVKKTDAYEEMAQTLKFIDTHDKEAGLLVQTWLNQGLPIPVKLLAAVWPDKYWRSWLIDLVVTDGETTGFLRNAVNSDDSQNVLQVVDLDGETVEIKATEVVIPHPALIEEIEDMREFATELGISQRLQQVFRDCYTMEDPAPADTVMRLDNWNGGHFEKLQFAVSRANSAGAKMSGGYATVSTFENGKKYTAQYWLGMDDPSWESTTEELKWVDAKGKTVAVNQVPPVAYSEGVRLAEFIYSGRTIKDEEK